ncbi:MAG: DNA polymerase I, partial [Rhizobacter sp.]|nr:DNA polymerase I [Chlorobiales bacterium]
SSDNVPGAVGIGPKTAAILINEYATIENLYAHLDALKPKTRDSLTTAREHLKLAEFLVTIKTDVPLDLDLETLRPAAPDAGKLVLLLEELEFKQLLARLKGTLTTRKLTSEQFGDEVFETLDSEVGEAGGSESVGEAYIDDELSFNFGANIGASLTEPLYQRMSDDAKYHVVDSEKALAALVKQLETASEFAFDTETTSLETIDAELVGMSFSMTAGEAYFVPCIGSFVSREDAIAAVKPALENPRISKIGQNLKFDVLVMKNYGVRIEPVGFDTMLASYVLNPDKPLGMEELAREYLKYQTVNYTDLVGKGKLQKSILDVPPAELARYACEDADITLQLKAVLSEKLSASDALEKICTEIEFPLENVIADMERAGIRIDTAVLGDISKTLDAEIQLNAAEIFKEVGTEFNLDSPKQLGEILFDRLKLPPKKRTKTGYSTDIRVLEELAESYPVARRITQHRSLQKLKSTYVDALPLLVNPKTGRVHTSLNQHIAATGRLSSSNPNLQNIPIRTEAGKQIRKAFVASDKHHVLLAADYSQIELRIAAEFSGDETMLRAFREQDDIHTATARVIFDTQTVTRDMRRKAKEVNFGVLYGIMPFGLAQRLDIMQSEAKKIIEDYKAKYPKIFAFLTGTLEQARTRGYVETRLGRRRYFTDLNSKNFSIRNAAERAAINMPVQGTAADMIKIAMIDIASQLRAGKFKSQLILQVHDELLFDAAKFEIDTLTALVKTAMLKAAGAAGVKDVPIEVEVGTGDNWLEAH